MFTVDSCWICESLTTVFNSLEINVKNYIIFLKSMKFVYIVVVEYLLFNRCSEYIRPFGSIH